MKNKLLTSALFSFTGFLFAQTTHVTIDLLNITNDKVPVRIEVPTIKQNSIQFHLPKTVPGTYSVDDYGRFIEGIEFLDQAGKTLPYTKQGLNSFTISNATKLKTIKYWVNDSFDDEQDETKHKAIFSPSGTDIEEGKCFVINTHGFVGYFKAFENNPFEITIKKPANFFGVTALIDQDTSDTTDTFTFSRYFEVTDSPIMYTKPNYTSFMIDNMEVQLGVYSPTNVFKAEDFRPNLEKMMRAQKSFLGDMNDNKKYAILLYLSDMKEPKIKGFGALEHHESTFVVLPETIDKDRLEESIKDVVSHEFFHTVNPLKCHSEEIHYFDYADPKMSKHLWLYEGGTEYFANLFQIQEGLIDENAFIERIDEKINNAAGYNDTMPFTKMSANVLNEPYKDEYRNVYEKGTLLTMCMDIFLLEESNGQMNYREMVRQLAQKYGKDKPFKDNDLIKDLVNITKQPKLEDFYNKYIDGNQPTPYKEYLEKVGVQVSQNAMSLVFFTQDLRHVGVDEETGGFTIYEDAKLTDFAKSIGLQQPDIITHINGEKITKDNVQDMFGKLAYMPNGNAITLNILRNGKEKILQGIASQHTFVTSQLESNPAPTVNQQKMQYLWLHGIQK